MRQTASDNLRATRGAAKAVIAGACTYWLVSAWLARGKWRRRPALLQPVGPSVTFLKPIKPSDSGAVDRIAELLTLLRDGDQIIAGVSERDTRTLEQLSALEAGAARSQLVVVRCIEPRAYVNPKISKLLQMDGAVRNPLVVLTDSEVVPERGWIEEVRRTLSNHPMALVTAAYRFRGMQNLAEDLDASAPGLLLWPGAALRLGIGSIDFAFGALLAAERTVLASLGGWERYLPELADDNAIAGAWRSAKLPILVLDSVVILEADRMSVREVWHHQIRVARTYREAAPVGFAAAILVNLWVTIVLAVVAFGRRAPAVMTLLAAIRFEARRVTGFAMQEDPRLARMHLLLLGSAVEFAAWMASWLPLSVRWGAARLRIRRGRILQ